MDMGTIEINLIPGNHTQKGSLMRGHSLLAIRASLVWLAVCCAAPATGLAQKTMHCYHIGNSLTRSITMDRLHALMASRGIDYQFGTQLKGGATLKFHWNAIKNDLQTKNWESIRQRKK